MSAVLIQVEGDRRDHILTAAERAFARHGFHGASMQHVAAEALMSAGNLYRYFRSKDEIVSGLTARDRAGIAADFQHLAQAPDLLEAFSALLRKHLCDEPVWRGQLVLEIWAEAARNPGIAAMCGDIDDDVETKLATLIGHAQSSSPALRGGEPAFAVRIMKTVIAGLIKRRATEPHFDGESEIAMALGTFRAALNGTLRPYPAEETST